MHTETAFQAKHTFNLIIVMFESEICISALTMREKYTKF